MSLSHAPGHPHHDGPHPQAGSQNRATFPMCLCQALLRAVRTGTGLSLSLCSVSLCGRICEVLRVSLPPGSGAASRVEGNSHLFRLPGVVSVVPFQVKAVITFLKAERLPPLLLPDSKLTFFFQDAFP